MKVITITDNMDQNQFNKLARAVGMLSDAIINEHWGSFEFKMEAGNLLPHVPVKESRGLYKRSSNSDRTKETRKTESQKQVGKQNYTLTR